MPIVDDTDSIGPALARLEEERLRRFAPKRLLYDPTTNAGEFVWKLIQSGKMAYPTVAGDICISAKELRTAIEIRKYIQWLDENGPDNQSRAERPTIAISDSDANGGMPNLKILFCRLRLLQLL
jgi:hypothetical protein